MTYTYIHGDKREILNLVGGGKEGLVNLFTIHSNLQYIFTFVGTYFEQGVGVSTGLNFTIVDVYIHTRHLKLQLPTVA